MLLMGQMRTVFFIAYGLTGLFILCVFGFLIAMIFSPKLRGKMMSKQVKATRYMVQESKDDMATIGKDMTDVGAEVADHVVDEHADTIKNVADTLSTATQGAVKTTVSAVREGLQKDTAYCKHCGAVIDRDSKFCKECGGQQ